MQGQRAAGEGTFGGALPGVAAREYDSRRVRVVLRFPDTIGVSLAGRCSVWVPVHPAAAGVTIKDVTLTFQARIRSRGPSRGPSPAKTTKSIATLSKLVVGPAAVRSPRP